METEPVVVRLAAPEDAAALAWLVAGFRDHLRTARPSDADLGALLPRLLAEPSLEFAIARLDGADVGYTQMRLLPSLWAPPAEAFLEDLYVLPEARRHSVGHALLRAALARARDRGARLLGLTTNEHNEPAQALYRTQGLAAQSAPLWKGGREIRWTIEL